MCVRTRGLFSEEEKLLTMKLRPRLPMSARAASMLCTVELAELGTLYLYLLSLFCGATAGSRIAGSWSC